MSTKAKLFLTDYASYNEGKQFEYGHWVELNDFLDVDDFNEYVNTHFTERVGVTDYEPMYTDFEGFSDFLYSESLSDQDLEKIFKYIEIGYEDLDDDDKIKLWNEYCSANNYDDEIYEFDNEFFNTFFLNSPMEAARAAVFGSVNWSHDYITFDGSGNLESFNNAIDSIDENLLIEWLIENK
jgi:hypothetical protein